MSSDRTFSRRSLLKGAAAGGGALLLSKAGFATALTDKGPSTLTPPYALPSVSGVHIKSILTTGDTIGGYRMAGIPDGLGALDCGRTFDVFMNHEIPSTSPGPGAVRAHGSNGAFVSRWKIDRSTLRVLEGEDLTQSANHVHLWNGSSYTVGTTQWRRLCSADLPVESALLHGHLGTSERIFLDGEEVTDAGAWGRAWARIVTGPNAGHAWELPRLGKMSFENAVACPHGKEKTIVALFDDGSVDTIPPASPLPATGNPSEVFIYIGKKQSTGNEIQKAGLTNGKLYGVQVYRGHTLVTGEDNGFGLGDASTGFVGSGRFKLVEMGPAATPGDVSGWDGHRLEEDAVAKNVFRMQRPEDGAWDPRDNCNDSLYFVTTGAIAAFPGHPVPPATGGTPIVPADYGNTSLLSVAKNSRLWRLKFDDIDDPLCGGKIEILLSGQELGGPGWRMFDNICIDQHGRLLLQEDTGNHPWVARIWLYGIDTHSLTEIAHHDPKLFDPNYGGGGPGGHISSPDFLTQDEESSGIIDAEHILGRGWFLFDVQNHKVSGDPALVEGGQLLAMHVDPSIGTVKHHKHSDHHFSERRDNDHDHDRHDDHHDDHDDHGHRGSEHHH